MTDIPQFGAREPGWVFEDRPGAYAVAFDDGGRVLCVRAAGQLHLPGGGVHDDESVEAALLRELAEETGHAAEIVRPLGQANQYVVARAENRAFNKLGHFFVVRLLDDPRTDAEHEPLWVARDEAARQLARGFHRWALSRA